MVSLRPAPLRGLRKHVIRALTLSFSLGFGWFGILSGQGTSAPSSPLTDLAALLDPGIGILDANGDGAIDDLAFRILLADGAGEAEIAAAANLGARFGFETSATNLGLAGRAGSPANTTGPVVLVGRGAVAQAGLTGALELGTDHLGPGQGEVVLLPPGSVGGAHGGLALIGYDATGLLAAAGYLSGRFPAVWNTKGSTWRGVLDGLREHFMEAGGEPTDLSLRRFIVQDDRPGIIRAEVLAIFPDAEAFDSASVDEEEGDSTAAPLEVEGIHRLDLTLEAQGERVTRTVRPEEPWDLSFGPAFPRGQDLTFSLSDLYQVDGLFVDTNKDLVPDESPAFISLKGREAPAAVVDLATRIGLETAGMRLPLVQVGQEENDPAAGGFPILLGRSHPVVSRLEEDGKLREEDLDPGEGFVRFVEDAFGDRNALVFHGADEPGLQAVTEWVAHRVPYLWTYGKGEFPLTDSETAVRRFLQGRKGSGQVGLALTKLDQWVARWDTPPPFRVEIEMAAEALPPEVEALARQAVQARFPDADVSFQGWPTGFGVGDTIFAFDWEIPWEVDEVRELLSSHVYPAIQAGEAARVEVRVSEPPEVRSELAEEIRASLVEAGAASADVQVLSAYKQGYSWINDMLIPRLREMPVASIDLTYHTLEESEEVRWQTIAAETRWLQEVYPIDVILARELGIPEDDITFHPTRSKDPIYTFRALDEAGQVLMEEIFDPRYVVRPFFDLFPEYEQVRVTTGWIRAESAGATLLDQRVVTDPERFWDRLQTEAYGEIIRYVMDIQDGDPSGDNAPFFDEFRVDLRMSEPDYRIGVDEEIISSLEALHEDIYFETHTLFSLIGGRYQTSMSNPGRVLPFVDPTGVGQPGRVRLSLTGKERGNPALVMRAWSEGQPSPLLQRYELTPLPVEEPRLIGATVADGEEGLRRLRMKVTLADSLDRFQEFSGRSSESAIDRQFPSVELMEGMLRSLRRLHQAGVMEDVLSWDRVDELAVEFRLEDDTVFQRTVVLPRSGNPASTDRPRLDAGDWRPDGSTLVQWETPISIEENEEVLAKLGAYPGVHVYHLTDSYLGNPVWAVDFLPPHDRRFVSQAKLNALKPTLFISGREHANEVSSTSHILKLGELLVTDSAYSRMLDRVNVVLHPIANPDGAVLAYERQLVNPDHMLHAGRPGALGLDATSGGNSDDPTYPESQARRVIREAWLPDIYLNPHGYPSHEWVQYFAGYSAWARGRRVGPRMWWAPRGWFIPGFSWVEDGENPDYQEAQFAILDSMAAAVTSDPAVHAMNQRLYARYKKYGEQDRDGFTEYFHNGMYVSMRLKGEESIGTGLTSPRITYFSVTTEAPDETARGEWMDLMGRVGLAHTTSALRYLANGTFEVEREAEAFDDAVMRKFFRVKPVLPKNVDDESGGKSHPGNG